MTSGKATALSHPILSLINREVSNLIHPQVATQGEPGTTTGTEVPTREAETTTGAGEVARGTMPVEVGTTGVTGIERGMQKRDPLISTLLTIRAEAMMAVALCVLKTLPSPSTKWTKVGMLMVKDPN